MRLLLAAAAIAAVVVPGEAVGADRRVSIPGTAFQPARLVALVGDTVTWTNADFRAHNVTSAAFASPDLARGQSYTAPPFVATGSVSYRCTIHAGMQGTVAVYSLYLAAPVSAVRYGQTVVLSGIAPEGSAVSIQRASDGQTVAGATASGDGSFAVTVPAPRPGLYTATAAGRTSPSVRVAVRPRVAIHARRAAGRVVVMVSTTPAQQGATVVLERARPSGWARIASRRLDSRSRVSFSLRPTRTIRVRARLVRAVGGYSPSTSASITLRR